MARRTISRDELQAELRAQGVRSNEHFAFVCPACAKVQSATTLIRVGVGADFETVQQKALGYSCVGRFTDAGPPDRTKPEKGCNWTLGGLLRIHQLEIEHEGETYPFFELATPEQAQALQAEHDLAQELA